MEYAKQLAKDLAESVMNINHKSGEIGEGFALNLKDKADKLLKHIQEDDYEGFIEKESNL